MDLNEYLQRSESGKEANLIQIATFVTSLIRESERSAVLLAGERLNVSLHQYLSAYMLPPKDPKKDELFSGQRPLSTFSGRIDLAYRLGLLDENVRRALTLVREMRNEVAHATMPDSIDKGAHESRVRELVKILRSDNVDHWKTYGEILENAGPRLRDFLTCVVALLVRIEHCRFLIKRPEIVIPATIGKD